MRILLLLFILLAGPSFADGHPVTMWRVDGASNSIYLLGSIHLLRQQDHPLPSVIDTAYEDAEVIVMELDMDDLDPMETQQAFNRAGVLRDGQTLRDLMGDELYAEAETAAMASDIPIELLSQSEPWLAAITVELMALYRIGFNPMFGVEMTMTTRAARDGKPIEGLETVEEQLSFLDGLPLDVQNEMLLQTLRESAGLSEQIDELIVAWRHGDTATLDSGLLESIAEETKLHDVLIVQRNRAWVDAILEWLDDDEDYLVVVGALHLVGDDGVPTLLEQRGIGVHQLSEPAAVR